MVSPLFSDALHVGNRQSIWDTGGRRHQSGGHEPVSKGAKGGADGSTLSRLLFAFHGFCTRSWKLCVRFI